MNILIVGEHGTGKSNMVDLLRNMIYKLDKDCTITTNDPDRSVKVIGSGHKQHQVDVLNQEADNVLIPKGYDVVVYQQNQNFKKWFDEVS